MTKSILFFHFQGFFCSVNFLSYQRIFIGVSIHPTFCMVLLLPARSACPGPVLRSNIIRSSPQGLPGLIWQCAINLCPPFGSSHQMMGTSSARQPHPAAFPAGLFLPHISENRWQTQQISVTKFSPCLPPGFARNPSELHCAFLEKAFSFYNRISIPVCPRSAGRYSRSPARSGADRRRRPAASCAPGPCARQSPPLPTYHPAD